MDNELFELCKEVYKRFPEWNDTYHFYNTESDKRTPLYTSDYLLEKLPESAEGFGDFGVSRGYSKGEPAWRFYFQKEYGNLVMADEQVEGIADTPLKALLKLVLALDDAGVKL